MIGLRAPWNDHGAQGIIVSAQPVVHVTVPRFGQPGEMLIRVAPDRRGSSGRGSPGPERIRAWRLHVHNASLGVKLGTIGVHQTNVAASERDAVVG